VSFKYGHDGDSDVARQVEHETQVARVRASELLASTGAERHGIYPQRARVTVNGTEHGHDRRTVAVVLPAGCRLSNLAAIDAESIWIDGTGTTTAIFTPAALVALGVVQMRDQAKPRERRTGPRPVTVEHD
jgi:hypothetical protein